MLDKGILPNTGNGHGGEIVATFSYTDEAGKELFQVVRYDPKDFRQRRQGPNGWVWNVKGVRRSSIGCRNFKRRSRWSTPSSSWRARERSICC
jgi:hypothetical protein